MDPLQHEFSFKNLHLKIPLFNHVCQWVRPRAVTLDKVSSNLSSDNGEKSLQVLSHGWSPFCTKVCASNKGLLQCMNFISATDESEFSKTSEPFISSVGGVVCVYVKRLL